MSFLKQKETFIFIGLFIIVVLSSFRLVKDHEVLGLRHPESAFLYKGYIYVSNIGSSPTSPNKDGFITKLDKYGNILEYKFVGGFEAPKGIFPYRDKLFVADLTRVCIVNLINKKVNCEPIPGSVFLNDIYVLGGNVYVTDTVKNCVYKIDKNGKVSIFFERGDFSPNGIVFSKKLGAFIVVSFNDPVVNEISLEGKFLKSYYLKGLTGFDGIWIDDKRIYISDYRTGRVIETNFSFKSYRVVKNFDTPAADIFVKKDELLAPLLEANELYLGHIR